MGGREWKLQEVPMLALYHRIDRWCHDQVSAMHRGLWTRPAGGEANELTVAYANQRLPAPISWFLNTEAGLIPTIEDNIDEHTFPLVHYLISLYDDTVARQKEHNLRLQEYTPEGQVVPN